MLGNRNNQYHKICVHCSYNDLVVTMAACMRNMKQHSTANFLMSIRWQRIQLGQWRLATHYVSISDDKLLFFEVKSQKGNVWAELKPYLVAIHTKKVLPDSWYGSFCYHTSAHTFTTPLLHLLRASQLWKSSILGPNVMKIEIFLYMWEIHIPCV